MAYPPSHAALFSLRAAVVAAGAAALLGAAGCSSSTSNGGSPPAAVRPADPPVVEDLGGRKYALKLPTGYTGKDPAPLVLMLHGFSMDKDPPGEMDAYMHVSPETEKRGIILAMPLGTLDKSLGYYTWNATDACCGWNTGANDLGYLLAIVTQLEGKYNVDRKRIFLFGHSMGGFMTHRTACDQADRFAAAVSLAGEVFKDPARCAPSAPISVLQIQGDKDESVPYGGGSPYGIAAIPHAPGAEETIQTWVAKNRCTGAPDTSQPPLDLAADLPGAETTRTAYTGCEGGVATELWTIHGGPHSPHFNASWPGVILDFLMAHPKP